MKAGDPVVFYVSGDLSIQKASSGEWALWRGGRLLSTKRTRGLIKREAKRAYGVSLVGWQKKMVDMTPEKWVHPSKRATAFESLTPWDDCKVAFGVDASADELYAWAKRFGKYFPRGWTLEETDSSGARMVAVFSVEGLVERAAGEVIRKSLDTLAKKLLAQEEP